MLSTAALTSCDDDQVTPPMVLPPTSNLQPTMTFPEFKAEYWSSLNAPAEVGKTAAGDSIVLVGRVCSSDESGNIYKNIYVQAVDENGDQYGLTFAVNETDLYTYFPFGQEVAIVATGLTVGGYGGLMQFGEVGDNGMTFMSLSKFTTHVRRNGSALPVPSKVDTTVTTIAELNAAKSDMMKWQGRLIRLDNVRWADAGKPYANPTDKNTNRNLVDADGNTVIVRNNSYSKFSGEILPSGTGSVTGILNSFNGTWQILLNGTSGVKGFDAATPDNPDTPDNPGPAIEEGDGTQARPYNATQANAAAAALDASGKIENAYIRGYVTEIKNIDTGSYGNAEYYLSDSKGGSSTLLVYRGKYFNGDKFTSADQLKVGDDVVICGTLVNFNGKTPEVTTGSSIVSINGKTSGGDQPENPDEPVIPGIEGGTEADPYTATEANTVAAALDASGKVENVYIKGFVTEVAVSTQFGNADYYLSDTKGGTNTLQVYRGKFFNGDKFTAEDQLKVGDEVVLLGTLVNYNGSKPQVTTNSTIISINGSTSAN